MFSTMSTFLTRTGPRLLLVASLIVWSGVPAASIETLVEIPVPLTVVYGAERSRFVVNARISESMELVALESTPILDRIGDTLLPEIASDLQTIAADRWLQPDDFARHGIALRFDHVNLAAELRIPVTALGTQTLSIFQERALPPYHTAENARLALGIPAWFQYRAIHPATGDPVTRYTVRGAPGLYLDGWVLESELNLDWGGSPVEENPDFTVENTRLVRTWADSGVRLQAGQFVQFTRGLQSPIQLLGVSLDNLQADTERTLVPALFDRPLVVDEPGTIDVYLNERRTRSFSVQPGQYELRDIPVTAGINTVRVEYTRDSGVVERYDLIASHAGGLLDRGAISYAVALGVQEDDLELPAGSGFLRYGLGGTITTGVLVDASTRGAQGGLELVAATPIGETQVSGYGSFDEESVAGWAAQGGYRFGIPGRTWFPVASTTVEYRSPDFARLGTSIGGTRQSWQFSTTVSQTLPFQFGLVVGHVHRMYHDDLQDSSFLYSSLSRSLGRRVNLRVTGFVDLLDADEQWGASITLSTRAVRRSLGGSATADARNQTLDLTGTAVHPGPVTVSGSARIRDLELANGTIGGVTGSARATGSRFDLTAGGGLTLDAADSLQDQEFRSGTYNVQLGTGLYMAGGVLGIGAPMRSSFALVRPDRDLPTRTATVRSAGRSAARESGFLGPAVLGPLSAGTREAIMVEVSGIPADYGLGRTEYILAPEYRSGTAITIVPSRRLYVRGRLLDANGQPVEYAGLIVTPRFEPGPEIGDPPLGGPAFSDETGLFEIYGLIPGDYTMALRDGSGRETVLSVPDEPGPLVTIEDIRLQGGER